jgi:ATP adenylyltransferase/5',5'''-P-1,P-4-tetraphosphate phosphorylase II
MWENTYTQQHLEQADNAVFHNAGTKHTRSDRHQTALECQVPLIKLGEPCVYNHSESARNLCVHFYEILKGIAVMRECVNETVKRLGYNTGVN